MRRAKVDFSRFFLVIHILIYLQIAVSCYCIIKQVNPIASQGISQTSSIIPIGVVLDTDSPFGSMLDQCIEMALQDFYSNYSNYTTVLQLHPRNAQTLLDANFAVLELLEDEQVEGVIGPQESTENMFVSELGQKTHVPMISITARSLALDDSINENKFFVRTTADDSTQARALADLCHGFQWPKVILLYEDTEHGHRFQSHLSRALRDVDIGLVHLTPIALSADNDHLSKLLGLLKQQETRVFLVHATPSLGFRLFDVAKKEGMMEVGYAWLVTDSLSSFLSTADSVIRDSMEGVVGVRPYVPSSKDLTDFEERWGRVSRRGSMDLNVYGLWAYDTIKALAIAAENTGPLTPPSSGNNSTFRISSYGPRLLRELSRTRFRGLCGYFELSNGSMMPSKVEIINLIGTGERRVGIWSPRSGIFTQSSDYNTTKKKEIRIRNVIWPGDSTIKPKGWAIPVSGILRVGVPWKPGFKQFVNVVIDPETNETRVTGFAIDIFLYAMELLPFPINYEFLCYNESMSSNWTYDGMLHEIPEKYDMVVADTTIWAPRATYVDFALPYMESDIVLVVRNSKPLSMWIFIKPLSRGLWLTILAATAFVGFAIWRLEYIKAARDQHAPAAEPDPRRDDDPFVPAFFVSVVALAFQERGLVRSKTSVFVLVCWLLTALVLMQSYTANLSAILTIDQLKFSFSEDHYFGYHKGSFTLQFLTERLHISRSRLIPYESAEEYHDAMRRGSRNGGVDAIFDELPYMNLLMKQYDSQYQKIGPSYTTDGFGFAFAMGSPLVAHFSRAILNVTQGERMTALQQKNFGPGYSSQDPLLDTVSQGTSSLTLRDFAGLFLIVGGLTVLAIVCAQTQILTILGEKSEQIMNTLHAYRSNNGYGTLGNREEDDANAADTAGDANAENRDDANAADAAGDANGENQDDINAADTVGDANAEIQVVGRDAGVDNISEGVDHVNNVNAHQPQPERELPA